MQCKRNPSGMLDACLPCEVLVTNNFTKRVEGEISFTFNTWTSEGNHNYLSVTAHYINSPKDQPEQWALKEVQLAFAPLEGSHSGENIASVLYAVLERYGICEKVCMSFALCTAADD